MKFLRLLIFIPIFLFFIFPHPSMSLNSSDNIDFAVFRKGKLFGHHKISFDPKENGDLVVNIDIELEVKIGFISFFSYKHKNKEIWRDGKLVNIVTKTDDNGKLFKLNGRLEDRGFVVNTGGEEKVFPREIVPTSYWNFSTIAKKNWLDTQRGILLDLTIDNNGSEKILNIHGKEFSANRYDISNDLNLSLWYKSGSLVKIAFEARGSKIEYFKK